MHAAIFSKSFAHLADSPFGIPKLRETILQLAVMGKLVPQVAAEGTGAELLARIESEISRQLTSGIVRQRKPIPGVQQNEVPFDIPPSWAWARLQSLGH